MQMWVLLKNLTVGFIHQSKQFHKPICFFNRNLIFPLQSEYLNNVEQSGDHNTIVIQPISYKRYNHWMETIYPSLEKSIKKRIPFSGQTIKNILFFVLPQTCICLLEGTKKEASDQTKKKGYYQNECTVSHAFNKSEAQFTEQLSYVSPKTKCKGSKT